jgi:plasmid maintenance system antidote protein VapI
LKGAPLGHRLARYFGNRAQFWLDLQSQYDISLAEPGHVE